MIIIYTLSDPVTKQVRYVGKTSRTLQYRYSGHLSSSKSLKTHSHKWINSLLKQNLVPVIDELDKCEDRLSELTEQYWISQFRTWGFDLTNHSIGGEGSKGAERTESWNKKVGNSHRGKILSTETRNKIRVALIGRKTSKEIREKISQETSKALRIKMGKSVIQMDKSGQYIKEFNSIVEASESTKTDYSSIRRVLTNERKTAGGFRWSYKN